MAEIITGTRTTYNINQEQRVIDISDKIALLEPDSYPLTVILRQLGKKKAVNPEFKWIEDELSARASKTTNTEPLGTNVTEIPVENVNFFKSNQVVKVLATGEELLVVNVSGNNLIVKRGYGSIEADNIPANADILIIGTAFPENSTEGEMKSTQTVIKRNYTQIFKTPFGVSRTTAQTEQYGEKELAYLRRKMAIEHAVDIERTLLFGEPKEDVNENRRKTGGVLYWIKTNVHTPRISEFDEGDFLDFLEVVYRYNRLDRGSSKITLLASSFIVKKINEWAKNQLIVPNKSDTYGISVVQYIHPFGSPLNIVNHPLLVAPGDDKYAIALNMELLSLRIIQDTILKTNIQNPNVDGEVDMYLTELGLELQQEKRHGVLKVA